MFNFANYLFWNESIFQWTKTNEHAEFFLLYFELESEARMILTIQFLNSFFFQHRSRSCEKKVLRGSIIFFSFQNFGPIILTCLGPNWTLTKTNSDFCSITIGNKKSGRGFFCMIFFLFVFRCSAIRKNDSLHVGAKIKGSVSFSCLRTVLNFEMGFPAIATNSRASLRL